MTTGKAIRALRIKAGMTQAKLAQLAGITFQQLSKYERGIHDPRLAILRKLAAALGVPPGSLV